MKILKSITSFISNNPFIWVFVLVFYVLTKLKGKNVYTSLNKSVNAAIGIIDNSIDSLGTFDSDLKPILVVFRSLSATEIKTLYNDFGVRYYNPITRKYSLIQFLEGYAVAREKNLQGLLDYELDESQKNELASIHLEKGLSYPYLAD